MKTVAVVAWREIVEHRNFMLAAGAALLLSLLVSLVSGRFGASPPDVLAVLTVVMATGFTVLCGVLLGASTLAGTTAAGRLGFFLARPLGGGAVWFGKLIGVAAVIVASEAIIGAPAWLPYVRDSVVGPLRLLDFVSYDVEDVVEVVGSLGLLDFVPYDVEDVAVVVGAVGLFLGSLVIVLVSHAVATMWRGGTTWLILDLLTVVVGVILGWLILQPLIQNGAASAAARAICGIGTGLATTLGLAPVRQLTRGGADLRRQHRLLSKTLALGVIVIFGAVGVYARWLTTPSAADALRGSIFAVEAGPNGRWLIVEGVPKGRLDYAATYLIDLESSESLRIEAGKRYGSFGYRSIEAAFSGDGSRTAWLAGGVDVRQVQYAELEASPLRANGTSLFVRDEAAFKLSADGSRIAIVEDNTLSVNTFPGGRLLASIVAQAQPERLQFGADGIIRFDEHTRSSESAWDHVEVEFDPESGSTRRTRHGEAECFHRLGHDETRGRLLIEQTIDSGDVRRYVDASTLDDVPWTLKRPLGPEVMMLVDGRLVDIVSEGRFRRAEVLTPEGRVGAVFPLPPLVDVGLWGAHEVRVWFGGQPARDRLVIYMHSFDDSRSFRRSRSVLVNLDDGSSTELGHEAFQISPRGGEPPVGSPASRLFQLDDTSLAIWIPETGKMEDLAARYE